MPSLKSFSIRRSSFTNRKIESLMRGMSNWCYLEKLELSFCQLTNTKSIAIFLNVNNNKTLKALELRGNYLSGLELLDLGKAINQYEGKLHYLGLSQNPLNSIGVECILCNILNTDQVNELDISGCHIDENGVLNIIHFVQAHATLRSINLTAIPIMDNHGADLVRILRENYRVLQLQHKSCGLSKEQEMNLRILLERNNYYEANPILRNSDVTPDQGKEIDKILQQKMYGFS